MALPWEQVRPSHCRQPSDQQLASSPAAAGRAAAPPSPPPAPPPPPPTPHPSGDCQRASFCTTPSGDNPPLQQSALTTQLSSLTDDPATQERGACSKGPISEAKASGWEQQLARAGRRLATLRRDWSPPPRAPDPPLPRRVGPSGRARGQDVLGPGQALAGMAPMRAPRPPGPAPAGANV